MVVGEHNTNMVVEHKQVNVSDTSYDKEIVYKSQRIREERINQSERKKSQISESINVEQLLRKE